MAPWIWLVLEQFWSFLAVGLAVYQLGVVSKRVADRYGWRRLRTRELILAYEKEPSTAPVPSWYDLTLRIHPVVGGALFGFAPLPTLHVIEALPIESRVWARCGWFMLAGALSGQIYEATKFAVMTAKKRFFVSSKSTPSDPPPAGDE